MRWDGETGNEGRAQGWETVEIRMGWRKRVEMWEEDFGGNETRARM